MKKQVKHILESKNWDAIIEEVLKDLKEKPKIPVNFKYEDYKKYINNLL